MTAVAGQLEQQWLPPLQQPAWFTEQNGLFDDARDAFRTGTLVWDGSVAMTARLVNDLWTPDFAVPTNLNQIIASAWIAPGVAMANIGGDRGYCRADGVLFPLVSSERPLTGIVIYQTVSGQLVWAATDYFGNLPVTTQNVYVVPPASFSRAWFRL